MFRTGIKIFSFLVLLLSGTMAKSQLTVTDGYTAQELAQRLVGGGVIISNASYTGNPAMAGFFRNSGGTNINIDSGIVLTCGRAVSRAPYTGVSGNGVALAQNVLADNPWFLPGDADLANAINTPANQLFDACVLEFDFVVLGDSVKFNYVFSSEEYSPSTVCLYNDAFAFFISGPGIPGLKNIALVPNTNIPVSIFNVNDVPAGNCANNQIYYRDNGSNTFFTHNGHTTVLTAKERVQPCQTYHLKIVISDVGDNNWDSGVFLQAKSLSSNAVSINNLTQTDPASGTSYLVEGCATGAFDVKRPFADPSPLVVNLSYAGTAINGTDVQLLPSSVIIPANQTSVRVNVNPIVDGLPEGIETIKIYALAGCAAVTPTDSALIQLRDYDILSITPDTAFICKTASVQLTASTGYSNYQWNTDPTLSSTIIRNPVATPVNSTTTYTCTATEGTCHARDSVFIKWKDIELLSKTNINCKAGSTGIIKVLAGYEWTAPLQFSLDGINWQADSIFTNLPTGNYWVKVKDAACIDSIQVSLVQAYPDLLIDNTTITDASCSGNPDGQISVLVSGGNAPYQYSLDGTNFQPGNSFNLLQGNYTVTVKDNNGCVNTKPAIVALNNSVTVEAGNDTNICEGTSFTIPTVSNATSFAWTPASSLSDPTLKNPVATPPVTTKYYVTATTGICNKLDSVTVTVRPAPVADAGPDATYCFGKVFQLQGDGGASYQWSPSQYFVSSTTDQSPSVKATSNITYQLMVTDASGCVSLSSDAVNITVTPPVKIFAGNDTVAAINQPVQLQVRELGSSGVTQYTWSPANYLNNANSANPVAILPFDYRYVVTASTPDGCEGKDDIFIKVYKGPEIYVPSAFTPNGDGLNDWLIPVPVGIRDFHYFRVFNRWGQLVYATTTLNQGWDGKINGVQQPSGTFVWIAEAVDYKGNLVSRKGVLTIIR